MNLDKYNKLPEQSFAEIQAEAKEKARRRKDRLEFLKTAGYQSRFLERVCYCGRKHNNYTRECTECAKINDNLEHNGIEWIG